MILQITCTLKVLYYKVWSDIYTVRVNVPLDSYSNIFAEEFTFVDQVLWST